jgi:hypothetical protein
VARKAPDLQAITTDLIERYLELDRERKELQSAAESKTKECECISKAIKEWMQSKHYNTTRKGPYTLTLSDGPKYPKWKEEYLATNGEEAVSAVVARTKPSVKLTIVHK